MYILGISAFYHDSAACLLRDGEIVAASQEERFTRIKHDSNFPIKAVEFCLMQAGITIDDISYIGFYEKPFLKFERITQVFANFYPKGRESFFDAMDLWTTKKLWQPGLMKGFLMGLSPSGGKNMLWDGKFVFSEHHISHASSAFHPSPFEHAAVVSIDGVGEWASTSIARGYTDKKGVSRVEMLEQVNYPHSVGLFYSAFTYYLGFKVNSGEYKVMGLAPYGNPTYVKIIEENIISLKDDGSYELNMDYFSFPYSHIMITEKFEKLFGVAARTSESKLETFHFDIAASLQIVTERIVTSICKRALKVTGSNNLCLAGGVALNCVANGKLLQSTDFKDIWIQPAAGDAGGSLGVAYYIWFDILGNRKSIPKNSNKDLMKGSYLGPEYSDREILEALNERKLTYKKAESSDELFKEIVGYLCEEKVIGWFQGKMEFGPRALGNRSIIGDPRSVNMQKTMNLKIKFRESFRPFAPSVLREKVNEWFAVNGKSNSELGGSNTGYDSPYMLLVHPVQENIRMEVEDEQKKLDGIQKLNLVRSKITSCTHVDFSARIHTVTKDINPKYYGLINCFYEKTGVPLLINTSFNVRGEPIVCTPDDAIRCFLGTGIDVLVLGNFIITKESVPENLLLDYKNQFELD